MARPTTYGNSLLGPKTVGAFLVGITVGFALVSPVLPDAVGQEFAALLAGSGSIILIGVVGLAVPVMLLAILYQLYL